jgi:uncharacterized protein YkwD
VKAKLMAIVVAGILAVSMAAPAWGLTASGWKYHLLVRINNYRVAHGLHRLRVGPHVSRAARAHSNDMAAHRMLSHSSSSGADWLTRLRAYGFRGSWAGENLAVGMWTPRHTLRMWIRSPEHRANLLNRHYRAIGMGLTLGTWAGYRVYYITADFGGP